MKLSKVLNRKRQPLESTLKYLPTIQLLQPHQALHGRAKMEDLDFSKLHIFPLNRSYVLNTTAPQENSSHFPSEKKAVRRFSKSTKVCACCSSDECYFNALLEFICYHSPVLKAAFNNDRFVEGDTQTYRLDDIRPSCFRLFTQWVYTQDFDMFLPSVTTISAWPKDIAKDMAKQDLDFAQLWVLGDKFLIHHLQNKVIDKFYAQFEAKVPLNDSWFRYAYENTSDSSPLRKYAVDHMMRRGPDYKKRLQQIPCEMFLDLVQSLIGWDKNPQMILNTYYVKVTT